MGFKRTRDGEMADFKQEENSTPFAPMFDGFRQALDQHQDRRERVVKASRDITASSKKIIFTLQRVRTLGAPVPQFVNKNNAQYWETIEKQYKSVAADLQGLNAYRYPNIGWGTQEFIEALSFQHYLETQTLITYEEASQRIEQLCGDGPKVMLAAEDYVLGIFDMIGELMRFSITSMATNGQLPSGRPAAQNHAQRQAKEEPANDRMDIDSSNEVVVEGDKPRNVLDDLREIRLKLEMFEPGLGSKFSSEVDKKSTVMRECVDKVEKALYSLTVRGQERPKGWRPDVEERRPEVETY